MKVKNSFYIINIVTSLLATIGPITAITKRNSYVSVFVESNFLAISFGEAEMSCE